MLQDDRFVNLLTSLSFPNLIEMSLGKTICKVATNELTY